LRFARLGGGVGVLDIVLSTTEWHPPRRPPVAEWTLAGGTRPARAVLYQADGAFDFWTDDVGRFRVDPDAGCIELPSCGDEIAREQRLWGIPSALCYLRRGDFPLHAAAVEVDRGALLLAAPGGCGKTTLALAFHRHGYRVLSEDLTCCRVHDTPVALPGPALLRVRRDMFDAPPAGTHVVAVRPDRVSLALDRDQRGDGAPVPIRAIVFLRVGLRAIRIEPVPASSALPDLWALAFHLPTAAGRASAFHQLARLAAAVPVWNLFRPLEPGALEASVIRLAALR
jgi:hypothetical protein